MKTRTKTRNKKRPQKSAPARSNTEQILLSPRESDEIVLAIRHGKIDALVTNGDQIRLLQDTDLHYRVLVETINDGVATLDTDGIVLYANTRFAAILRVPAELLVGTPLQNYVAPSARRGLQALIAEGLSNSAQGAITLGEAEARARLVKLALNPVSSSVPRTVCVVATELTELIEANEALKSNEESLRQLSARLLKLQDEERRRIARDLHDVTGQKLVIQAMALSQVLTREQSGLDEESLRVLTECAKITKQVGDEIRTLSYLLHPPLLDELGLSSAVKWYAEGFERRTGIRVRVDIASDFVRLPRDVETTLFRVIQESLTNMHRYSGTTKAYVRLNRVFDQIKVRIGDFGKGIHPDVLNSKTGTVAPLGVGIQGMRERLRQLDGKLEIISEPNRGTIVTATLPISHPQAGDHSDLAGEPASSSLNRLAESYVPENGSSRKQILIADDHEMLRKGLRSMLQSEMDWEVCGEAVNGQDAVDKAIALRPDLVILDINMPVLNGLAAIRQILRGAPDTKILVFTVHDSEQTVKEARAAGAHGCLSKANASENLLKAVKDLLDIRTNSFQTVATSAS